jgi:hypothetical protein
MVMGRESLAGCVRRGVEDVRTHYTWVYALDSRDKQENDSATRTEMSAIRSKNAGVSEGTMVTWWLAGAWWLATGLVGGARGRGGERERERERECDGGGRGLQ